MSITTWGWGSHGGVSTSGWGSQGIFEIPEVVEVFDFDNARLKIIEIATNKLQVTAPTLALKSEMRTCSRDCLQNLSNLETRIRNIEYELKNIVEKDSDLSKEIKKEGIKLIFRSKNRA